MHMWLTRFSCMCKDRERQNNYDVVIIHHNRIPFVERSTSPIHLSAVMCDGTESRITDCPHSNSTQNLNHGFDAYIVCRPRGLPYSSKSLDV